MASQRLNRFKTEISMLLKNPPPGITCRQDNESLEVIIADITGPPGSPFEKGTFTVEISLSDRYPFTPPVAKFITPIYHPNIDTSGRICLSGLKPKPAGCWNCSMNIAMILSAIRLLLSEPNLGDPLMADIATEYKDDFSAFRSKAEEKTMQYACSIKSKCSEENKLSQVETMDTGDLDMNCPSTSSSTNNKIVSVEKEKKKSGLSVKSGTALRSVNSTKEQVASATAVSSFKKMRTNSVSVPPLPPMKPEQEQKPSKPTKLTAKPAPTIPYVVTLKDNSDSDESSTASDDDFFVDSKASKSRSNPRKKPRLSQ